MSVEQRCASYRESDKGSEERQGPTLGVGLTEGASYRESDKGSEERQGPILGVRLTEVCVL